MEKIIFQIIKQILLIRIRIQHYQQNQIRIHHFFQIYLQYLMILSVFLNKKKNLLNPKILKINVVIVVKLIVTIIVIVYMIFYK